MNNSKTYKTRLTPWQEARIAEGADYVVTLRYTFLMHLAWDLQNLGVGVSVHLPFGQEMYVRVPGAANDKRITADLESGEWWFSWGHNRKRRVAAGAENAAMTVLSGVV
ncbi:hypothetical protein ACFWYW_53520 [Nonomuraea sp. NPDC059023]|uniref:hypothetical protein n=1 Tax=unclassified Nonomuraea TaxID=2593643 RepID=UPI00368CEDAF